MTAIVYRQLPDRKQRQYIHRLIDNRLPLWRTDRAIALPMPRDDAKALADALWMRSQPRISYRSGPAPEPAGEYGVEDVTP